MIFKNLTFDEKKAFAALLNWDYNESPENILAVIEGQSCEDCAFNRESLFVRSLERLKWQQLVDLWGLETCQTLYTEKTRRMLRSQNLRNTYDHIFGILRGKPVPPPEWGSQYYQDLKRTFLSKRWNRPEPGVL